jgi:hypothetical protein
MFWFQVLIVFYIVNKQEEKNADIAKIAILENLSFLSRAKFD